jgi:hypothetical protein
MNANDQIRNDSIGELLEQMIDEGEHSLTASDILLSFINNVMLQEERDEIIDRIKKEE